MIKAILYHRPHAETTEFEITDIEPEDEQWFVSVNAKISAEDNPRGGFILYADVGIINNGEVIEAIEITGSKSCKEAMHDLRVLAEKMLGDWKSANTSGD